MRSPASGVRLPGWRSLPLLLVAGCAGCAGAPLEPAEARAKVAAFAAGERSEAEADDLARLLHTRTEDVTLVRLGERSYLAAAGVRREGAQEMALAGRSTRYAIVSYDEVLVRPAGPDAGVRVVGATIYVNRAAYGSEEERATAVRVAAASLLFPDARDPDRRDARILVALLDSPWAPDAIRLQRAMDGTRAAALARAEVRAAGFADRLEDLGPDERRRVVETSLRRGGLLDAGAETR